MKLESGRSGKELKRFTMPMVERPEECFTIELSETSLRGSGFRSPTKYLHLKLLLNRETPNSLPSV